LFDAPTINQFSELVGKEQSLRRKSRKLLDPGTIVQQVRRFIVENYLDGWDNGLKDSDSFLEHGIIDPMRLDELVEFLEETYGITAENDVLTATDLDSINNVSRLLHRRINGNVSAEAPAVAEHIFAENP
jgi:acyl carrier protein